MLCSQVRRQLTVHSGRFPPFNKLLQRYSFLASSPTVPIQLETEAKSAPKSSVSITKDDAYLQTIIPKRIEYFEAIKAEQIARLKSIAGDPIKVTLPDGIVKEGKRWETTPLDI